jgi:DNA-binding beta-propeller fold protein YncE
MIIVLLTTIIYNCADKFDLNDIDLSGNNVNIGGDTVFVQVNPVWEGFNKPQDIIIGKEPFIYVADTDNDRIVMMNLDGQILGTRTVKKPVALAQDYKLNLIICGQFDTLGQSFSAVYKLDLFSVNHQLEIAPMKRLLPRLSDFTQPQRQYTGAAVFYDNRFYISRTGPNNSNLIDPDNSILIFVQKTQNNGTIKDSLIGRVALLDPTGTGIMSANQISSLTSYTSRNYDLLVTLRGDNSFKVQPLEYIISQEFTGYQIAIQPGDTQLMETDNFDQPEGATVDGADNIYVADAGKDSVYKFNSFGQLLIGFNGAEGFKFDSPNSVAFFDRTLYVADTGNNRILRFILSTDLQ